MPLYSDTFKRLRLSRRAFLSGMAATASGVAAACSVPPEQPRVAPWQVVPTRPVLPSPQPEDEELPLQSDELTRFLFLSTLLTGIDELDPVLGEVYLESLQNNQKLSSALSELYELVDLDIDARSLTLQELENSGIFELETFRDLTDKIAEYWYTGAYETADGGQAVATFTDALAWKVMNFTKPQSVCGALDFWAVRPEVEVGEVDVERLQSAGANS